MRNLLSSAMMRRVAMLLVFTVTLISLPPAAGAGFIPSDEALSLLVRQQDMASVQKVLEQKVVTERLKAFGYDQNEISDRLARLSDQELHQLASQVDTITAAGDGLSVIISVLLIVVLVLVILKLADRQIVIS